ncbi:hypothetical protein DUNSADRAFT_7770 [Dunaliella salina]|nr:hypothetical protein DUNSADRAFT_7770 [Dunaliella salina]|eukprot:KAF5835181.1 hypothetical protein DUNSADRAFT_7770 [Dunaliella salina]
MRGLVSCLPILEALNLNLGQREARRSSSDSDYSSSLEDEEGKPRVKPDAGCSLAKLQAPPGAFDPQAIQCWQEGGVYNVRGEDYPKTRTKIPGEPSLYKVAAADVFGFPSKHFHIAESVNLPQPSAKSIQAAKAAGLPPMMIFHIQLPIYSAPIFGPYDGEGISIVTYTHLPEDFDAATYPNQDALGLIKRMVDNGREADGTLTRDRLKLVPRVVNVEEWVQKGPLSMSEHTLLAKYNDKPILTRPQQFFFSGENYLEIDFDVHQYTYLARRAITAYIQRLHHVVWETAFIVQGNTPEELPEQVVAASRIYRLDFMNVRSFMGHCKMAAEMQQVTRRPKPNSPSLPSKQQDLFNRPSETAALAPSNTQEMATVPEHPPSQAREGSSGAETNAPTAAQGTALPTLTPASSVPLQSSPPSSAPQVPPSSSAVAMPHPTSSAAAMSHPSLSGAASMPPQASAPAAPPPQHPAVPTTPSQPAAPPQPAHAASSAAAEQGRKGAQHRHPAEPTPPQQHPAAATPSRPAATLQHAPRAAAGDQAKKGAQRKGGGRPPPASSPVKQPAAPPPASVEKREAASKKG